MIFSPPLQILELGASHVALGVFEKPKKELPRIAQYSREGFDACLNDDCAWLDRTAEALQRFGARHRGARAVTLVLPGHSTLAKHVTTPRIDPAKREQIIRLEAEQSLPIPLEKLCWGHAVMAENETDLDSLVCAAREEVVTALCLAAERAGFEPVAALPSCLTLLASYRSLPLAVVPAAVIEIGARSTLFIISGASRSFVRIAAIGGRDVTVQMAGNGATQLEELEKLKRSSIPDARRELAIDWFVTRIAQEFKRTLAHVARNGEDLAPRQIYIGGGGTRLAGFAGILATRVNLPVEFLPAVAGDRSNVPRAQDDEADAGLHAALLGGAWLRAESGQPCVDLLPPNWRARRSAQRRWTHAAAATLACSAALAPAAIYQNHLSQTHSAEMAELEREISPLRQIREKTQQRQRELISLTEQAAFVREVSAKRNAWPLLLADLERRFAAIDETWIVELRELPVVPEGKPANTPRKLECLARTLSASAATDAAYRRIAALLADLAQSPFVETVENQRFQAPRGGLVDFHFSLVLRPGAF